MKMMNIEKEDVEAKEIELQLIDPQDTYTNYYSDGSRFYTQKYLTQEEFDELCKEWQPKENMTGLENLLRGI